MDSDQGQSTYLVTVTKVLVLTINGADSAEQAELAARAMVTGAGPLADAMELYATATPIEQITSAPARPASSGAQAAAADALQKLRTRLLGTDRRRSPDWPGTCPACYHTWTFHTAAGCIANVGDLMTPTPCPCQHSGPPSDV